MSASRFLDPLVITPVRASSGRTLWRLVEEFGFYWAPMELRIVAPAGFVGDLASVPRWAKAIVDDDDPDIVLGAVIHDWLYHRRGALGRVMLTRAQADAVLRDGMRAVGAREWRVRLVYAAVRLGGGAAWK